MTVLVAKVWENIRNFHMHTMEIKGKLIQNIKDNGGFPYGLFF